MFMKKIIYTATIISILINAEFALANDNIVKAFNGAEFHLTGNYYHANTTDIMQKNTPVISFEGLTKEGGKQIVNGYKQFFKSDVMGDYIKLQLGLVKKQILESDQRTILKNIDVIKKQFPELISFWQGLAAATNHTLDEIYLVAWAEEGLFAKEIQKETDNALKKMAELKKNGSACTAIGWSNGILGQTQDMNVAYSGWGAIWQSPDLIVHAPTPFFTSIVMGKKLATTTNIIEGLRQGSGKNGVPISAVLMAIVAKNDNVYKIPAIFTDLKTNGAYSPSFVDLNNQIITIEITDKGNKVIDGTQKGYIVHTNHPIGEEKWMVQKYAQGNWRLFDNLFANTLWRLNTAKLRAIYSPEKSIDALKDLFRSKPVLMQGYKGNAFVTTNAIIHDLRAGCTYGTTWSPKLQEFTKVCFEVNSK
uniref:Acyl-coenzyme A:6-aminopenicillanic acid acyl-transferase n=2 Tax=Arsenophonus nasoniae TaxID=638 RepID=D2TW59_9GAMM|nr:conserved hypothetical protein [Arsenophonus nasoniae]